MNTNKKLPANLGHEFQESSLLQLALRHRSAGKRNNERLEFLGDAVLGFIISEELYKRFPQASEGELSRFRAQLVQKSTLAEIARELQLGPHLTLGAGEYRSGGANRESILADAVEAIISALYVDGGLDVCRRIVLTWYGERLDGLQQLGPQKDSKTRLQELLQGRRAPLPRYQVEAVDGLDHAQHFSVSCHVKLLQQPVIGQGSSRREAEQAAATLALQALGESHE